MPRHDHSGSAVSVRDVATLAGVSVGTVSNVLNHPELVAPATRDKVHAAVEKLGFVRNESARHLRAGQSRMIGLVVLDAANPFFSDLARGVEDVAASVGSQVVLGNSGEDAAREDGYVQLFEETRVQGLLISPVHTETPRLARLRERGIPVVLVDRKSSVADVCSVSVDDMLGGRLAVEHLIETGHRHIAAAGGPIGIRQVAERRAGAAEAVRAADAPVRLDIFDTSALTIDSGRSAGDSLAALPAGDRPTAVFALNDLVALGILQALTRHGLKVPQDIAIIGYDDIEFAAAAAIPLSSVRQPSETLGRTATELLLDEIHDPDGHHHQWMMFQPELIVRESTTAPPELF